MLWQGLEKDCVEKDVVVRRNECEKLGIMGGDVSIAQGGSVQ
jgi:hypothetical protein